jgi:hypothetical protein
MQQRLDQALSTPVGEANNLIDLETLVNTGTLGTKAGASETFWQSTVTTSGQFAAQGQELLTKNKEIEDLKHSLGAYEQKERQEIETAVHAVRADYDCKGKSINELRCFLDGAEDKKKKEEIAKHGITPPKTPTSSGEAPAKKRSYQ